MLNLPTVLQGINSWGDLEKKLALSDNQTKGAVFEHLTKKYLQFEPRYAAKLRHVWLLKEVPTAIAEKLKLPKTDQGIDLFCETHDGDFWSVQCKFVTNTDIKLSHRKLSTFVGLSLGLSQKIRFALICTTADDYAAIYRGKPNIGFVLSDEWQKLGEDFFHFARGVGKKQAPPKLKPRPHQAKAIRAAERHFIQAKATRGKLVFPCGAGKSLTGYWIARKFAAKSVVVAVPSLALVKQTLETYLAQASADKFNLRWLCVCSDETIGKNDDVAIHTQDLGIPCVTDPTAIAGWLQQNKNQPKVIFTTYQSARMLGEAVRRMTARGPSPLAGRGARRAGWGFDLGILDEAHKTVGASDKLFSYLLDDKNVKIRRRIFMTATERRYRGSSDDIVSMDDEKLFGDTFDHMSFAQAVKDHVLSDYKIVTLAISNRDIAEAVKDNSLSKDGVEARSYAALVALRKAMQKYPIHHAVSFHGSIAKAEEFKKQQDVFSQQHPEFAALETFHVSGAMPTARRSKVIEEFKTSPSSLITNAKCLTEGVDVPKIDAVLFADPRRSTVDIVQAVGRALRRSPGKKFGYVILPLFTGDATGDEIPESAEFKEIIQTLRALASNDERIVEYFRDISKGKTPRGKLIEFDIDVRPTANFSADDMVRELQLRTWNRLAKLNWRPFEEAREFVRGLGLRSYKEWAKYSRHGIPGKSPMPPDIPTTADLIYRSEGWESWSDWLGHKYLSVQKRQYLDYKDARKFVRSLGLKKTSDWHTYAKSKLKPINIPGDPYGTYKNKGWAGMGDWLGTDSVATYNRKDLYLPFARARAFVQKLGFRHHREWKQYCAGEWQGLEKPINIPSAADKVYADQGWKNWGDWFGTGKKSNKNRDFLPFEEARDFVRSLKLKNRTEWRRYLESSGRSDRIPTSPDKFYANSGWQNFGDWLGTGNAATFNRQFRPFNAAREFVRSLKLKNSAEWYSYSKSEEKPADIPAAPHHNYKNQGWLGMGDWLGTGNIAPKNTKFQSFEAARHFAQSLGLKSHLEWVAYCASKKRPADIPSNPSQKYKFEWRGWPDFLGTASGKPAKKPRKKKR